jgi:hypothetical protein
MNNYMPSVITAVYNNNFLLDLEFDNGEQKTVDFSVYLSGEIFEPLKDLNYFKKFFVDGTTVSWPNGADIAPETLYRDGVNIS